MAERKKRTFVQEDDTAAGEAANREIAALWDSRAARARTQAMDIPISRIQPNPFQPRQHFEGLEELAATIRAQGFTSRLRVRRNPDAPGTYQLVFGERRLRAAQLAELETVPCDVAEHTDAELMEMGLAENIQRQDLTPLEEARSFQRMIEAFGYSHRSLAERIGKAKGYVENRLLLLRAPQDIQDMVAQRSDTIHAARDLITLEDPTDRRPIIDGILAGHYSQRDVRSLVRDQRERMHAPLEQIVPSGGELSARAGATRSGDTQGAAIAASETSADASTGDTTDNERPAQRHLPEQPRRRRSPTSETAIGKILDRDESMLRVMLSRWRIVLTDSSSILDTQLHARLRAIINTHMDGLQQVVALLDSTGATGEGAHEAARADKNG